MGILGTSAVSPIFLTLLFVAPAEPSVAAPPVGSDPSAPASVGAAPAPAAPAPVAPAPVAPAPPVTDAAAASTLVVSPETPTPAGPAGTEPAAPSGGSPKDYGPFMKTELPTETNFPSGPPLDAKPRFSVGQGLFCFVEDSQCKLSLIASADVGIGVNAIATGSDLPYAQYTFRGGLTVRPLALARKRFHWWGVGVVASYSRGSGVVASNDALTGQDSASIEQTPHTAAQRFSLINQAWLSQKRNGFHLDLTFGLVRSTVLTNRGLYLGSHVELAGGFGGWGALFVNADFMDRDTRLVAGFRGHGIAAAPVIGLILLGLLAGGAW